MSYNRARKSFLIVGSALKVNGFVFLSLAATLNELPYLGVGLGSLGAAVALSALGWKRKQRAAR